MILGIRTLELDSTEICVYTNINTFVKERREGEGKGKGKIGKEKGKKGRKKREGEREEKE